VTLRCPGKKHDIPKLVTNVDKSRKIHCREVLYRSYDKGEFPIAKKLPMN
jgi:hypothetical protein